MSKYQMDSMNGLIDRISFELIDIKDVDKVSTLHEILIELRKRINTQDDELHDIAQSIENLRGEI